MTNIMMKIVNFFAVFLTALVISLISFHFSCRADIQVGGSTGTLKRDPAHISVGSLPLQKIEVYKGGQLKKVWEDLENPVITAFDVVPKTLDLDTTPSGTIVFTIGVTGTAGSDTFAQIVRLPDGTNIGPTHVARSGANINTTLSNILQPNQTTTYRLFVHNEAGASHKDTTITVTKNPGLANCRRTGVINRTHTYFFGFTLTGLPRPTVTYAFSGGQTGTVSPTHLTQGANPYTWTSTGWQIVFANSNAQSLTLTATNSSGSTTCTIANINN